MKKAGRIASLFCILALACGLFAGCGGVKDTEDNLVIESYLGGYGTEFLYRLKDRFEEIYPEKTVQILESVSLMDPEFEAKIKAGPSNNPTDLFLGNAIDFNSYVAKGKQVLNGYDNVLEDLTDILDSSPYGESGKIRNKIIPEYLDFFTYEDGGVYSLPWAGGVDGLVYNVDMFEENDWEVPRTTDKLAALADEIAATSAAGGGKYVPFIWPGSIGYWETVHYTWWAQYESYEGYLDFFMTQTKDSDGNYTGTYTDAYFMQEGRYEAMAVLEQLIYGSKNSYEGSITLNHTNAQMYFLNTNNHIAMMPNGDWLENEMLENFPLGSVNIAIMKTPVISAIVDKLPKQSVQAVAAASGGEKTADDVLDEVIAAIDRGDTSYPGIDAEDFDYIAQARRIVYSNGFNHNMMIPSYANAKELAKDFIRLMVSDEGLQIFYECTGSMLPYNCDYYDELQNDPSLTTFRSSKFAIFNDDPLFMTRRHSISKPWYLTGLEPYSVYAPESKIGGIKTDAVTASTFIESEIDWVRNNIDTYFSAAGIQDPIYTIM